jgi:hypothetical protein
MLREIAAGMVLVLSLACSSGLSPVVRCKLEAVRVLPDDPMQATVYDAADLVERLRACHRLEADGGP